MQPFDLFPASLQKILVTLEDQDRKEREAKLDRMQRLRQIPRETGEFLFQFLTVFTPQFPEFSGLEIGTSGGYSTLWQGMALAKNGMGRLISIGVIGEFQLPFIVLLNNRGIEDPLGNLIIINDKLWEEWKQLILNLVDAHAEFHWVDSEDYKRDLDRNYFVGYTR